MYLALGKNRLLAIEENRKTNQKLRRRIRRAHFSGIEIGINGGGGAYLPDAPFGKELTGYSVTL